MEVFMNAPKITLTLLTADDRNQFILDNQYAFKYGAVEEFGLRLPQLLKAHRKP